MPSAQVESTFSTMQKLIAKIHLPIHPSTLKRIHLLGEVPVPGPLPGITDKEINKTVSFLKEPTGTQAIITRVTCATGGEKSGPEEHRGAASPAGGSLREGSWKAFSPR